MGNRESYRGHLEPGMTRKETAFRRGACEAHIDAIEAFVRGLGNKRRRLLSAVPARVLKLATPASGRGGFGCARSCRRPATALGHLPFGCPAIKDGFAPRDGARDERNHEAEE